MNEESTPGDDSVIANQRADKISLPREVIESLPEELRNETPEKITEYILSVERIRSPLIPPWLLNQYSEKVQAIIVAEVTEQRRHRTKMESRRQLLSFALEVLKLTAAFISVTILITGSIDIIQSGQSAEGLLGIGGTVTLVVGAFLYRDYSARKDRREHAAAQQSAPPPELPDSAKQSSD